MKNSLTLSISYGDYSLKLHNNVEYLGCYLNSNLKGESMACRVLKKINTKPNFLWRQSNYLNYLSRRVLCNALIQPPFDYGCTFANCSKQVNTFLLGASVLSRDNINPPHFRETNWHPIEGRVEFCTSNTVFKFRKGIAPSYLNDMFKSSLNNYNTRSQTALDIPLFRRI